MSQSLPTYFRLADLPAELIIEITIWAQVLWREESFAAQGSYARAKRYAVRAPVAGVVDEYSQGGVNCNGERPRCLRHYVPLSARSPAHAMSQTGRWLRRLLLNDNSAIWRLDNALYKEIAERSGVRHPKADIPMRIMSNQLPRVEYGTGTLIAEDVCECLMTVLHAVFSALEDVKIALPRDYTDALRPIRDEFFVKAPLWASRTLKRFTVEIYTPESEFQRITHMRPQCVESPGLLQGCFANTNFYYYSSCLTSLYIHQDLPRTPQFTDSLSSALNACAAHLECLTIDAGGARFMMLDVVVLSRLQRLRVLASDEDCWRFLTSLRLPLDVDIHLEPVVEWRALCSSVRSHVVPFAPIDHSAEHAGGGLRRYANALAAPDQMRLIFRRDSSLTVPSAGAWETLTTLALNVGLDGSTSRSERACGRFPEYVTVAFAESVPEMEALLAEPGRHGHNSSPRREGQAPRRSLTVRDGEISDQERARSHNTNLAKPLYDSIRHVLNTILSDRETDAALRVHPGAKHLVLDRATWLPIWSLGWLYMLDALDDVVSITFLCPPWPHGDAVFAENVEGYLIPAHLEAMAQCLNEPGQGRTYICPELERIELRRYADGEPSRLALSRRFESLFNGKGRAHAGAKRIEFVVGIQI
ncbi:hypothetical protein PENSPDRAFT_666255 [Peniophora sp. CONT]|nr:hypothetical protein PENSPDRAFT_666255 [Peniophora sp. CONT]